MKKAILRRKYKVNKEITQKEVEGSVLFLQPDNPSLYTLNETGKFIWEQISKKKPAGKIIEKFAAAFNVPKDRAAKDVLKFMALMEKERFIRKE